MKSFKLFLCSRKCDCLPIRFYSLTANTFLLTNYVFRPAVLFATLKRLTYLIAFEKSLDSKQFSARVLLRYAPSE